MQKIFVVLIILNLLGTAGGAYFAFNAISEPLVQAPAHADLSTEDYLVYHNIFSDKPILYSLDPFMVNLANVESDKTVMIELNLEMHDEKSYEEIVNKTALVRDTVVKVIAQKHYEDISSVQGKLFLKDDISEEVNKQLKYGLIKGVYFSKFLVQ